MTNIKRILVETGDEPCEVDVDLMYKTILQLPAEKYLELYHRMQHQIAGYPYLAYNGGCCCDISDDTASESKV